LPSDLLEVVLIELDVYQDKRGFFLETYRADKYHAVGIVGTFVQDNHSHSVRDTLTLGEGSYCPRLAELTDVLPVFGE
jgi:dTDP-4-dehydrorhamnose 3,5-epimerase